MSNSEPTAADPTLSATAASAEATAASAGVRGGHETLATPAPPTTLNMIRYPSLMNMDYHAAREAWLDGVHRWLMFAIIASGAVAFLDAMPALRIIGPIIAVVCGALDLTFDLSNRARAHAMFRRRYSEILSEANRSPDKLTVLQCRLDELAGEEEPPFAALLAMSSDRANLQTYGNVDQPARLARWQRLLANVRRYPGYDFHG